MSHWYTKAGKPLYQIKKATGKGKRDTTLSDAKKLHLVPSVTTIMQIINKPMVEKWKIEQVLSSVAEQKVWDQEESFEEYKQRILLLARQKMEVAAKRGTEIHDKLENYFDSGNIDATDSKFIVPALNLLAYEFNGQKWVAEESFADRSGFGGKVDLYSKAGIIIDFKTKAKDVLDQKVLYDDYCMQLAAYRKGLNLPKAKCYNLVISTTSPGTLLLHRWTEEELQRGLMMFNLLLEFWKLVVNFDSGWEEDNE